MPDVPLPPAFGSFCNVGPLFCTFIDKIAWTGRVDLSLAPSTSRRGLAFGTHYGFSFSALERLEFGLASSWWVWTTPSGDRLNAMTPLRADFKGLIWPWRGNPHQHFTLAAGYSGEFQAGPFSGANQLGLFTNLHALRLGANMPLGLVDLGPVVGMVFDPVTGWFSGEVGGQASLRFPFLDDLVVYVQGLLRGWPSYVPDPEKLSPAGVDPKTAPKEIQPNGVLAFGFNLAALRGISFGFSVEKGFGGVAPISFTLRAIGISIGENHPRPRSVLGELLVEVGRWLVERIKRLPQPVQETCVIYDRQHVPMATLGRATADGGGCVWQGQRFKMGRDLFVDQQNHRVCLDKELERCLAPPGEAPSSTATSYPAESSQPTVPPSAPSPTPLTPDQLKQLAERMGALGPISGRLDNDCLLHEGNQIVTRVGKRIGKSCVIEVDRRDSKTGKRLPPLTHVLKPGTNLYRDPTSGSVYTSPSKKKEQRVADLPPENNRAWTPGERAAAQFGLGLDDKGKDYAEQGRKLSEVAAEPAKLTTAGRELATTAEATAKKVYETTKDPEKAKAAAEAAIDQGVAAVEKIVQSANQWIKKPVEQQVDDVMRGTGQAVGGAPVDLATGAAIGGTLRVVRGSAELVDDAAKAGKAIKRGEAAAEHGKDALQAAESVAPRPYPLTKENIERMQQGRAPRDPRGKPIELHHENQHPDGQLKPMTHDDHRGGDNFKKNHANTGNEPSAIDRREFEKQRRQFWKQEAEKTTSETGTKSSVP